jgi:DNA-binding NarL/FixJ family response regulator
MIAAMTRLRNDKQYVGSWAEGAAMNLADAVAAALALTVTAPPPPQEPAVSSPASESLTRREHEIARLLARGDSNRQIADALFISVGTVNVHVHRILDKLGLYSRQQVADWLAGAATPTRARLTTQAPPTRLVAAGPPLRKK